MRNYPSALLMKIMPFIGIGIFLVVLIVAFVLLSYVLLIGAVVGLVLFVVAYIKQTFFSGKVSKDSVMVSKKPSQTFDNDEFK